MRLIQTRYILSNFDFIYSEVQTHVFYPSIMGADDEFILIEDEDMTLTSSPIKTKTQGEDPIVETSISTNFSKFSGRIREQVDAVKDRLKPRNEDEKEEILSEPVGDISIDLDGTYSFEWAIKGMDCPDCAAKAKRALVKLPGVHDVSISATLGTVQIRMDIGVAHTSKVSSLLTSLGHEPDLPWNRIQAVTATGLAERNGLTRSELRQIILQIPSVMDVRFIDASIEVQILSDIPGKIVADRSERLASIIGSNANLIEVVNTRLDQGQWRLVSSVPAILILVGILISNHTILLPEFSGTVLMIFTLVGVSFSGWRMFLDAWGGLVSKEFGFQLLTSLAVIGAFFGGHWSEALIVSILVAIAAHMEESALMKAREAMQGGLDRLPRRARKVESTMNITGISLAVPAQKLSVMNDVKECSVDDDLVSVELLNDGDRVEIRSGEIVPVDGIVVEGIGSLNRAPLTGESIPVRVTKGDEVNAGLVLDRGPIIVEATAVGSDTRLSGLIDEVRTFRDRPPRIQGSIENFSKWWVPTVLVGAPLAGIIAGDVRLTLLLWVVACPCALLLAAPVPHAAALSTASLAGVVARGGDALEAAAHVDLALLDKTGTLTSGHPRLHEILLAKSQKRETVLKIAAGLEQRSNHPYAAVILQEAEEIGAAKVTSLMDGDAGVEGVHGGKKVMFGRKDWIENNGIVIPSYILENIDPAMGVSVLSKDKNAIAVFTFVHDDLRPGAAEMVHDLQSIGVAVELLSGDTQEAVEALGKEIGIPAVQCRGEIDPEGKAIWVERRSQGRRTLMAGDGFNDAAALAVADIGIAVGSGEQVNLDAADVLIPGEDPRAITSLLKIAKKTRTIVRFNLLLSILVTVFLVGAVMLGLDNLAIAVAVHELSVFVVILNGAFLASTGNRVSLFLSIFSSLFQDYYDAFKLLLSKESPQ